MAIRKDKVQLDVEINGKKAGTNLGDLRKNIRTLKLELNKLVPGTDDFIKKTAELRKAQSEFKKVNDSIKGVGTRMGQLKNEFKRLLPSLSVVGIVAGLAQIGRGLFNLGKESLRFFNIQAKADAQLKATLKSTNEAAGRSFEQLKQQAQELQKITLFGDEETQQAQALLATFTQVRTEVFDQSIPLIQDYATAIATASGTTVDLKSASLQVGKALNDPIKGISALGRAGVTFSEQQKEQIRLFQEGGETAKAQAIILKELESQFGGSAEAAAKAGLGGYTQIQNKFNDIKEGIGQLISNGLERFAPVLNRVADFFGVLVSAMISGEKATGEFSSGVNGLITFMKALLIPLQLWWKLQTSLIYDVLIPTGQRIGELINRAKDFPIIGSLIKGVMVTFSFLRDAVDNSSASFAGFRAAAQQAVDNIQTYFSNLLISARIVSKELDLALSIKSSTKDRLRKEIQDLKQLQVDAIESGRTIGEAYQTAKNEVLEEARLQNLEAERIAAEREKSQQEQINQQKIEQVKQNVVLQADAKRKAQAAEKAKDDVVALRETVEVAAIGSASNRTDSVAVTGEGIDNEEETKLAILSSQYEQALIAEHEYELASLAIQQNAAAQKLELMRLNGETSTTEFYNLEAEYFRIQNEMEQKRVDNTKRTQELRAMVEKQGFEVASSVVNSAIDILGKDEAARKKHGAAIKALEIAKIGTNVAAEISSIWRNAQSSPAALLLGPIAGNVIAGIQTVAAVARAGRATSKVAKQKFAIGGYTGRGMEKDETGHRVAGVVHENEWVAPAWMMNNPSTKARIENLEYIRRNGFAQGGLATVDTSPTTSVSDSLFVGVPNQNGGNDEVVNRLDSLIIAMSNMPTSLKANVVYEDIQEKDSEYAQSIERSSL